MIHSPATKAADDPHGGGDDGGGELGKSSPATSGAPPDAAAGDAPASNAPDELGFVHQLSRTARRKAAKAKARAARDTSQADGSQPPPTQPRSQPPPQPKKQPAPAAAPAHRPKLSAVDRMILQLREHVVMKAGVPAIIAVLVQVQHLSRPAGWETNEVERARITRTYDYTIPTDCNSIVSTMVHWFTKVNPIDIPTFKAHMRTFELANVPAEALPQKRNPWATPRTDSDDEPMTSETTALQQKKRWAKTPRLPTRAEQEQLAQVARGKDSSTTLPAFVKETGGVMAAAFLATVVEMQTRGHLVVQLRGVIRVPANVRQATLLRMVETKLPGPMRSFVERFKKEVVGARFDSSANAIVFTMTTQASASGFAGEVLPILDRLFHLQLLDKLSDGKPGDGETHVASLEEYELQVLNLSGTLWPVNILHVFHGLLGLDVTSFERAPPDVDGQRDYTLWNLTIASHGCPEALSKKTRIVWGEETLWLHHTAIHAHAPCTKCGQVSHPVRVCNFTGTPAPALTLTVEGPQLEVAAEVAAAARVDTHEYGCWLLDMESRMQDRSLEAAGRVGKDQRTYQVGAKLPPLYFDYEQVANMSPATVQEKIREQLLARVHASTWLVKEHERKCAQHPRTPPLAAASTAELQELLAARTRSAAWRSTREYTVAQAAFRLRVERVDEVLGLGPRILAIQTLASHEEWRSFEYTYAEDKRTEAEIETDALLALFAKLVRRPITADDDVDARLATARHKTALEKKTKATTAAAPSELHQRMSARWAEIVKEEARKSADRAAVASDILTDMQNELIAELLADAKAEAAEEALQEAAARTSNETADGTRLSGGATELEPATDPHKQTREAAAEAERRAAVERESSLRRSLREKTPLEAATRSSSVPPTRRDAGQADDYDMEQDAATDDDYAADAEEKCEEWHAHVDERDEPMELPPAQSKSAEPSSTKRGRKAKRKPATKRVGRVRTLSSPETEVAKKSATKAQVGIHQFLRKDGSAADMEVEFVRVQLAQAQPTHLASDWKEAREAMGLHVVDVPRNGSCGPYAASGVQWGQASEKLEAVGRAKEEAEYLRTGVSGLMHHNYSKLVRRQVIDESRLGRRFLNTEVVTKESRGLIEDELMRCGMQPCDKMIDRKCWWTTDELRALAYWLRQPLLVFDVNHSGPISAQLHALALLDTATEGQQETVETTMLSHERASALLAAYKASKVVPLVLVLDHKAQHFSGLRVDESRYEDHALGAKHRAQMKRRLKALLKAQGMYAPPARPTDKLLFTMLETQDSDGSSFTPSGSSGSASAPNCAPMRGPGIREMVRLAQDDTDDSAAEDTSARRGGDMHELNEEERKTDTEPNEPSDQRLASEDGHSQPSSRELSPRDAPSGAEAVPLFQASLVTPTSPMEGPEYVDLLAQVGRAGPVPVSAEVALKKAQRDNKEAFKEWKKTATHRSPELKRALHKISEPSEACDALKDEPHQLIAMLRQLPYIPVLAGRARTTLFTDLGKALMIRGRVSMLLKISHQAGMTPGGQQFCEEWMNSINNCSTNDDRLRMAQLPARWNKLPDYLDADQHPVRSISGLPDLEWGALLAHLLVSPSAVRDQVQAWELDAACAALLSWTSHDSRVHHTGLAATAFRDGHWIAPTEFLAGLVELSQRSLPPDASASGGGTSQY